MSKMWARAVSKRSGLLDGDGGREVVGDKLMMRECDVAIALVGVV